jgi:hypothetical protein
MSEPSSDIIGDLPRGNLPADKPRTISEMRDRQRALDAERSGWRFEIPEDCVSIDWGRPDPERCFMLAEVKVKESAKAAKIGKDNPEAVGSEMIMQALWRIGDVYDADGQIIEEGWLCRGNREQLIQWWDAIGPKGRGLVQDAWIHTHQADERSRATFLAGAKRA